MDLRQLKYFAAIYDLGNLSQAASHCNVAQSALSHHLAKLEDELGVALFTRRPRGMDPTAAGELLYGHATEVFDRLELAKEQIKNGIGALSGEITIGMSYSIINVIGVPLIQAVKERHPGVTLILKESLSGTGFEQLITGQCDLALLYNPPQDDRTRLKPILEEELFFIGHKDIIGDSPVTLDFADLTKYPLMLLRSGQLSRSLIDKPHLLHTLEKASSVRLASVAATIGALKASIACTVAPKVLIKDQLGEGTLIARKIENPNPTRTLYLALNKGAAPSFLIETMTTLIEDLIEASVNNGEWEAATLL